MKTIGIIELLTSKVTSPQEYISSLLFKKQYISITPQAISVWCRQMGHRVHYATYFGIGDPHDKLPDDLDIVFISVPTHLAAFAYALAKIYRKSGVRTVIGGPHAKAFPQDCSRYFDLVVLECDRTLIGDILNDEFAPGSIIASPKPYEEPPTVEERLSEIQASAFIAGRPLLGSSIPMLASVGCPYSCDFCIDWNVRYRALSTERLKEDLLFAGSHFPKTILYFHDPNFGVRFDEAMEVFEDIPPQQRNLYIIESSLKLLNTERLERLRDTKCLALAPGIESWNGYSNKAGVGKATGQEKLDQVVAQLRELQAYIPYLQANLILGLDVDSGDEPFDLTRDYLAQTPFVWPHMNIPMAFGGTPLFDTFKREGRILERMPFSFYRQPYMTVRLKHYGALDYLQRLVSLHAFAISPGMVRRRLAASPTGLIKFTTFFRTFTVRSEMAEIRETIHYLENDTQMRAFHEGETHELPAFYARAYHKRLGKYAELMPVEESAPVLSSAAVVPVMGRTLHVL